MRKKLKVYLDTSVINFLFAEDAPEKKEITIDFFENCIDVGKIEAFISDVVLVEINRTPDEKRKRKLRSVRDKYELQLLEVDMNEIGSLVDKYLNQKIIPQHKVDDARHIAIATVKEMDVLVSWNFKHLANIKIERKVTLVNHEMGYYYPLRLTTPMEVMG